MVAEVRIAAGSAISFVLQILADGDALSFHDSRFD